MLRLQDIHVTWLIGIRGLTAAGPGFILEELGNNRQFRSPTGNSRSCR